MTRMIFWLLPLLLLVGTAAAAERASLKLTPGWNAFFAAEIARIEASGLAQAANLTQWEAERERRRQELLEMLGLQPMPERTELSPVVTGTLEREDFRMEKVHFQASPGLYVTASLYLPKGLAKKAPAVLYVCGHSRVLTNGVSCGNKAAYQHQGSWFARNGFVCLVIDTLQYGEILGSHRGTYAENQWWWNSRGYTPAGVEAWFGMRAIDYLVSRPEVDAERIGMTGRSGGGAYSWTVAALDDRVKAVAPVAGMTDLRNLVLDGRVDGHCDCMFQVNTYRWDFPLFGALIAPRPLAIGNTDADWLFPLDGVMRMHDQIRRIYGLYGKEENLGLFLTQGDHLETSNLQVPLVRWFVKQLRPEPRKRPNCEPDGLAATKYFTAEEVRVFDKLPADQRNPTVAEWFNRQPAKFQADTTDREALKKELRAKVFAAWPDSGPDARLSPSGKPAIKGDLRVTSQSLDTQPGVTGQLHSITLSTPKRPRKVTLIVADEPFMKASGLDSPEQADPARLRAAIEALAPDHDGTVQVLIPRGISDPVVSSQADAIRFRRRFMLIGTTLDSGRVWDIRCAVHALAQRYGKLPITLAASGPMAVNAAYAALFQPEVTDLKLREVPTDFKRMPDYLNVLKVVAGVPGVR